jgi:CRP/FNR family transcriptional regulator, cyclic AMP receptor protein
MSKHSHDFSRKRKLLAAAALAQKIGYLRVEDFSSPIFDTLPAVSLNAHRIIRPKNWLCVIREGTVEIWHTRHDMLVTELKQGAIFGEIDLLGQTMLGCQAIAGSRGVALGVMKAGVVREWIDTDAFEIFQVIGPHLSLVEAEHYKAAFQSIASRIAGLLLELAGTGSTVEGYIQEDLAERLGAYRETITNSVKAIKESGLIEVGRKKITILNKEALRELSEL